MECVLYNFLHNGKRAAYEISHKTLRMLVVYTQIPGSSFLR